MKSFKKNLMFSIVILVISIVGNIIATDYVLSLPRTTPVPDILHDAIPSLPIYSIICEIALLAAFIIFAIYVYKKKSHQEIPFYISCLGIVYILRALILPLTPLPEAYVHGPNFGILYNFIVTGGTFFSGHTSFTFLLFIFIDWKDKAWKWTNFALFILMAFFMIISRGHYTIDIIAAMFISYTVFVLMTRYKEKLFGLQKIN